MIDGKISQDKEGTQKARRGKPPTDTREEHLSFKFIYYHQIYYLYIRIFIYLSIYQFSCTGHGRVYAIIKNFLKGQDQTIYKKHLKKDKTKQSTNTHFHTTYAFAMGLSRGVTGKWTEFPLPLSPPASHGNLTYLIFYS